jgi:hypothetical protein
MVRMKLRTYKSKFGLQMMLIGISYRPTHSPSLYNSVIPPLSEPQAPRFL